MKCEGSACGVVEIDWDGSMFAYRVRNFGASPVLVILTSTSGIINVRLPAGGDTFVCVTEFDLPYEARYCE